MKPYILCWTCLLLAQASCVRAATALRVLRAELAHGENLLENGGFEAAEGDRAAGWRDWEAGYRRAPGEGRDGSAALFCASDDASVQYGGSQTVELNQATVAPLVVRGWSRAENVSGTPDSGYSLYGDLLYQDGTPLWGQVGTFKTRTHDWQRQEFLIFPAKPVRSITLHALFRGHTGKVWFDDLELYELRPAPGVVLFDGVPVEAVAERGGGGEGAEAMETKDGLKLSTEPATGRVGIAVGGRDLTAPGVPGGFLARDVAANSDFCRFVEGRCEELNLRLEVSWEAQEDHLLVSGQVADTTGQDRAITLVLALPLDATGWRWGNHLRAETPIEGTGEYANVVRIGTGATGTLSRYPFANVHDDRTGLAVGIDMDAPAQYRLAYNAGTKQFFLAYDFGLTQDTHHFPGAAPFRFVLYRTDPAWGFRSAAARFYEVFPQHFVCRSKQQGIWMPFTDVSTVEGWEDFGFRYHEGINNVPFDDQADVLSFRYTEPSTWWMRMSKDVPRTYEAAMAELERNAAGGEGTDPRMAQVTLNAGSHDAEGQFQLQLLDTPWCDGAVFSLNPNPYLPAEPNAATVYWNPQIREQLYGPAAKGEQDGEYLDSLEGYVTADLNFRREHFHPVHVPLTFTMDTHEPVLYKAFSVYEFVRWMADDVHALGKLMFANSVPHRFAFLCGHLDIMGTETNWLASGRYRPMADAELSFIRTMCAQKPYLFLMNTLYDQFTPDLVERYFQRCLFYGMFPSMFSHNAADDPYWQAPQWYNRDRALFKRYQPLIKRVAEAGWQPITHAVSSTPTVYVERFGPAADGNVYVTVMNDGQETETAAITLDAAALSPLTKGGSGGVKESIPELVTGETLSAERGHGTVTVRLTLEPEAVRVLELGGG